MLLHRAWRRLYTLRHPDHPWLDPAAIAFLDASLRPGMTGLEWGAGRSTRWLASRIGRLLSIEHNPAWHARVKSSLDRHDVTNVDLRLIAVTSDELEDPDTHWGPHPYVMVVEEFAERSLDLVLVDGQFRQHCVARALPKLREGGLLVIDNVYFLPDLQDWRVPADWSLEHIGKNRLLDTAIWRRPQGLDAR